MTKPPPASDPKRSHTPMSASALWERISELRAEAHAEVDPKFSRDVKGEPIPPAVKLAGSWALRLSIIGIAIYLLLVLLDIMAVVVIPIVVSLLIAALLTPMMRFLRRLGLPKVLATLGAFLAGIIFVFGLIGLIIREFIVNYETIYDTVRTGLEQIANWLSNGPLKIDEATLQQGIDDALGKFKADPAEVVATSVSVISTTGSILAGILLSLFIIYFFLADGHAIWPWLCKLFPLTARWKVNRAGLRSWEVLVTYMNVTLFVAFIVGVATWIACLIAGVPLALSAGLVAFLFAFIPTLGGLISSIVVVLLTLVSTNLATAVAMTIVMVAIQTIQGNFIYPLLMNRQLKVHPLASLLLVVLGAVVGGIFGALIAVPLAAVINTAWLDILRASEGLPEVDRATSVGPRTAKQEADSLRDPTLDDPTDDVEGKTRSMMPSFGPDPVDEDA